MSSPIPQAQPVELGFSYVNITGSASTTVNGHAGLLHTITVNTPGSGGCTATLLDGTTGASSVTIGTVSPTTFGTLAYDVHMGRA